MSSVSEKPSQREGLQSGPLTVPEFELDPTRTALMVIDMQYCDAHREYGVAKLLANMFPTELIDYYFTRLEKTVLPNTVKLLDFFRKQNLKIVFVCLGALRTDFSDVTSFLLLPWLGKQDSTTSRARLIFHQNEFEYSLLPELQRNEDEPIFHKSTMGLFNSSGGDVMLRNMGVDGLIITGVVTNACVETTARDAADRGFKCILVEDACATFDEAVHNNSLQFFSSIGNVRTTEEVIGMLSKSTQKR